MIRAGLFENGTIKGGDIVYLRSGHHGAATLSSRNSEFITIASDAGARAIISSVTIEGSKWIVKGLRIESLGSTLVQLRSHASNNIIVGNHIVSQQDVSGWTKADWQRNSSTAVSINGECTAILDNNIENIRWGVLASADHVLIQGNVINNIGNDGMQLKASSITVRRNRLTNFLDIGDGNHADMIQSINQSAGTYRDIMIESNTGINQTDPNLLFPNADTQGITEFDGSWDTYNVINNVVITNHWHGIAIYGAANASIINNTVFGQKPNRTPWIGIFNSKSGADPVNNIVRNNLSGAYAYPSKGYAQDHNLTVSNPSIAVAEFNRVNHAFDLRLRPGSRAIAAGTPIGAPASDIVGATRAPPIDVGAYAFRTDGDTGHRPTLSKPAATTTSEAPRASSGGDSCVPPNYSACGYPDGTNTGVPSGIPLTKRTTDDSCLVVAEDNTVIEGLHVVGCIDVEANNVTIRNTRVTATTGIWWAIKYGAAKPNVTGLKILHVKIDSIAGQGPAAEGGYPYGISTQGTGSLEVGYSDISGFKDGINIAHGLVHNNWIHNLSKYTGAHTQGIYVWRAPAGTALVIKHNTITDLLQYSTAAIFMKEGLGIHDVTVEDNWLAGGSYTLYGGGADAKSIQALNNKFSTEVASKGGQYGPITSWSTKKTGNSWSGNIWANGPNAGRNIAPAY